MANRESELLCMQAGVEFRLVARAVNGDIAAIDIYNIQIVVGGLAGTHFCWMTDGGWVQRVGYAGQRVQIFTERVGGWMGH